jgi:hypothetical protein
MSALVLDFLHDLSLSSGVYRVPGESVVLSNALIGISLGQNLKFTW